MATRYRNGWWLAIKYHDEGLTQREIGELCDVSPRTIRKYMNQFGIETRAVKGENHGLYGKQRDEAVKERISETLEGREFDEETIEKRAETQRGREIPPAVREKISDSLSGLTRSETTRQKMSESTTGKQNPNWQGGGSVRYGPGWKLARATVRERDDVCQQCGHDGTTRRLEVHHIVPVRQFREASEYDLSDAHQLDNLVLLCCSCHPKAEHGSISFEADIDTLDQ